MESQPMQETLLTFMLAAGCILLGWRLAGGNKTKVILMKLSEVKSQIADAAKKSTEAFAELGSRIGDLQKQIDDLIAGASDPDVTDEAFLTDLNTLKTNTQSLADIVPNPTAPPV